MGRGQYDRHAARLAREARSPEQPHAGVAAPIAVPATVSADSVFAPITQPAVEPTRPVRLLSAHGYIAKMWSRDVRVEWKAGEIIIDPDEIDHLRGRGADLEPV